MSLNDVSVVLVHGAWADGSSWSKVIGPLQAEGVRVVAAPLPLTSLADDVAALDRALERIDGPVVLVGHAYAGAVIAATRNEKVRSLVYIAALAPDEGETVANVFYRAAPHPQCLHRRRGGPAALEGSSELVPRCRARPHDRRRRAAFHGGADEGNGAFTSGRSCADRDGARRGRGHHPRSDARRNGGPHAADGRSEPITFPACQ